MKRDIKARGKTTRPVAPAPTADATGTPAPTAEKMCVVCNERPVASEYTDVCSDDRCFKLRTAFAPKLGDAEPRPSSARARRLMGEWWNARTDDIEEKSVEAFGVVYEKLSMAGANDASKRKVARLLPRLVNVARQVKKSVMRRDLLPRSQNS